MKYLFACAGFLLAWIFLAPEGTPLMHKMMEIDLAKYQATPLSKKMYWFLIDKGFFFSELLGSIVGFIVGFYMDCKIKKQNSTTKST